MSTVTIEGVEFVKVLPSGKSFVVKHEGREYVIPNFAVHEDSEIYKGTPHKSGTLVVSEKIAVEKGLADDESGSTGIGIPLKRNRLPDPPEMMPVGRLKSIQDRAQGLQGTFMDAMGTEVYREDELVAIFEGPKAGLEARFYAHAIHDTHELLAENIRLRNWVEKVMKQRRRRKR